MSFDQKLSKMLFPSISFSICFLLSIDGVVGNLWCNESTIDSIAWVQDTAMYFIASGGHYWWAKETQLPPKDNEAIRLPNGFKNPSAAIFLDTLNGCKNRVRPRVQSADMIGPQQQEVWVAEILNGKYMLMSYDIAYKKWSQPFYYQKDRCLSKAKINWNEPIDAMFVREYFYIYVVQKDIYAMVDCSFVCDQFNNDYGTGKPRKPITDFQSKEPIFGTILKKNRRDRTEHLYIFNNRTFYKVTVDKARSIDGKIVVYNPDKPSDILKNFLKFDTELGECTDPQTTTDSNSEKPVTEEPNPEPKTESEINPGVIIESTKTTPEESGSSLWIIIVIIVIVLVIVAIGLFMLFAFKSKKTKDIEGSKQKTSGTESKPKVGSKTGINEKKPIASSTGGSKMSTPSKTGTTAPKSKTSNSVNSSKK